MENPKYQIDPEAHKMRQDIEGEYRNFWEKIVALSSIIFGAIIALSDIARISVYDVGLKLLVCNIVFGMFLIFLDNRRRRFYLDFATIITDFMEKSENFEELVRLLEIERKYGFGYDSKKDIQIKNYLQKGGLYRSRVARAFYRWGIPILEFLFYLTFIIALILIARVLH